MVGIPAIPNPSLSSIGSVFDIPFEIVDVLLVVAPAEVVDVPSVVAPDEVVDEPIVVAPDEDVPIVVELAVDCVFPPTTVEVVDCCEFSIVVVDCFVCVGPEVGDVVGMLVGAGKQGHRRSSPPAASRASHKFTFEAPESQVPEARFSSQQNP